MTDHYRALGRVAGIVADRPTGLRAASLGRVLFGHIMPWRTPVKIAPRNGAAPYLESFQRGSLRIIGGPVPLTLGHLSEGGVRIGHVARLWDTAAWCDAALAVAETPAGDAILDGLGADGGRLPLSIAFRPIPGGTLTYAPTWPTMLEERVRVRAELLEVSIVSTAAYDNASTYARGSWASINELAAAAAG